MPSVIFANDSSATIGPKEIARLKQMADVDPERRSRHCLHENHDDPVQEMVIVMRHESEVAPHRQSGKRKSYYVLEGAMAVVFFDGAAQVAQRVDMSTAGSGHPFVYRFDASEWHTVIPQTQYVVYVETIEGPYQASGTDWFPGRQNRARPATKPAA